MLSLIRPRGHVASVFAWLLAVGFAVAGPGTVRADGVSVLGSALYVSPLDGQSSPYYLLKLSTGSRTTYAQWLPAASASAQPAPALLYFEPYPGIGWSDDPVDQAWYQRGPGFFPDQNGPYYVAGQSGEISYQSETPQAIAADDAESMLRNQVSVLVVYGRFYRSSLIDQINDVINGLTFLRGNAQVDLSHVGVISGSWGGMAALYGIAQANLAPAAVALTSPISDAGQYLDYIAAVPGPAQAEILAQSDTYTRRVRQAINSLPGGVAMLSHGYLTSHFRSPLMVTHDTWDTAVPVEESYDLLTQTPNADHRAYFQTHAGAIDWASFPIAHTQSVETFGDDQSRPWEEAFLLRRLRPQAATKQMVYGAQQFITLSEHLKARRDAGEDDSSWAGPVYADFCNSSLTVADQNGTFPTGTTAQLLAALMSQVWNLPSSSASVCGNFVRSGATSLFAPAVP